MTRKIIISLLIVFVSVFNSFSQEEDLSVLSTGKLKKLGKKAMISENYYSAIRYYDEYCKIKEDYKIMYLLAESYRTTRNYPFAEYWYDKAYKANPSKNPKALYYYARMLQVSQDYSDAYPLFKQFKKEYIDFDDSPIFLKLVKYQMNACDTAPGYIKAPVTARVNHLNSTINTSDNEFLPIFLTPTSMIYASSPFDTTDIDPKTDSIRVPGYFAAQKNGSTWQSMGEYTLQEENNPLQYSQNGAFSPDYQRYYYIKCEKGKKNSKTCQIYQSKKVYGIWQAGEALPEHINTKGTNAYYLTVGNETKKNDEVVYFISDRPGGKGGLDLWYTIYMSKKEAWRDPKNCGNKINSQGDEITPYFDMTSRTMYYSSNAWAGIGQNDIFKTFGELGKWTPSENMGYPINTPYDDYYFTISQNGKLGFLASNRPGGASIGNPTATDDLYAVDFENIIEIPVTGKVFEVEDEEIKKLLDANFTTADSGIEPKTDSIEVHYIQNSTVSLYIGNTNEKVFIASTETDETGSYNFTVSPDKEYVLQFENVKTGSALIPFSTKDITKPDTLKIKDYGINYITKDPLVIKNVYYEYGKYKLTKDQKNKIDEAILKLLLEAPEIVIEISSHTDNQGSEEFNQKLSQKRAEEIVNYLVKTKKIDKNRLVASGFGFSKPIASNDTEEGRAINRRTEFRVMGAIEQLGVDTEYNDGENDEE